mgnify:CR=1 FL=1
MVPRLMVKSKLSMTVDLPKDLVIFLILRIIITHNIYLQLNELIHFFRFRTGNSGIPHNPVKE